MLSLRCIHAALPILRHCYATLTKIQHCSICTLHYYLHMCKVIRIHLTVQCCTLQMIKNLWKMLSKRRIHNWDVFVENNMQFRRWDRKLASLFSFLVNFFDFKVYNHQLIQLPYEWTKCFFQMIFYWFEYHFQIQRKISSIYNENSVFLLHFFMESALKVRLKCVLTDLDVIFEFSIKFWLYSIYHVFWNGIVAQIFKL